MFSWCWTAFSLIQLRSTQKVSQSTMCPTCVTCEVRWSLSTVKAQFGMAKLICWKWWSQSLGTLLQWAASVGRAKSVASAGPWGLMTPPNGPLPVALCSLVMQPGSSGWYQQLWLALGMENKVCKQWLTLRVDSLLHFFTVKDHQLGIPRHFWIAIGRLKR
jgi:hypothetical protein